MKIKKEGDISNRGYASAGSFKLISKLGLAFFLSILLLSITANAADVIVESGKLDVGNKLYVDANGNVGIGTTTPTQKLDVAGMMQTTGFKLITAPAAGYVLMSDASGVGTWQLPTSSGSGWTKAGSVVRLTAFTDLVGIGTATPSKKLHVKEAGADTVVAIDSGDIVAGEKYSAVDFYNDGAPKWGIGKNRVGDFYIDKSGAANVITILGLSRNVGINTTNPGSKLTVVGTLNVSGNLTGPGLYVNASGSVGIGTEHPGEKEHCRLRQADLAGFLKAATSMQATTTLGSALAFHLPQKSLLSSTET
ncbi:hypothetical protein HYY71_02700 [Candidatus Woesearchaeota archaeon]|nr:hypothetical protein [Candidatus Woesearchaeota archaeon]